MKKAFKVGYVCFGEVNTPIERLRMKHEEGLGVLTKLGYDVLDGGLVIDDEKYETADAALNEIADAGRAFRLIDDYAVSAVYHHVRDLLAGRGASVEEIAYE